MQNARIKFFNVAKGFGFVACDDGTDAFIHVSRLVAAARRHQVVVSGSEIGNGLLAGYVAARVARRPFVVVVHADPASAIRSSPPSVPTYAVASGPIDTGA